MSTCARCARSKLAAKVDNEEWRDIRLTCNCPGVILDRRAIVVLGWVCVCEQLARARGRLLWTVWRSDGQAARMAGGRDGKAISCRTNISPLPLPPNTLTLPLWTGERVQQSKRVHVCLARWRGGVCWLMNRCHSVHTRTTCFFYLWCCVTLETQWTISPTKYQGYVWLIAGLIYLCSKRDLPCTFLQEMLHKIW